MSGGSAYPHDNHQFFNDDMRGDPAVVGSAAEFAQLAAVDWATLIEDQSQKYTQLMTEREKLQSTLINLDQQLATTRLRLATLESELAQGLTKLLDCLDTAVAQRRDIFTRLVSATPLSLPLVSSAATSITASNRNGMMI